MSDFLLELLSEEIPARMQAKAEADLARLFAEQLAAAGLEAEGIETFSTPRRLALIARNLPAETAAVSEEIKGPRASAPPQALEGFLRKTGLTREQLVDRDGVLFAIIDRPGRATSALLAEAIPAIVRAFPWPKSMRWGEASASTESMRWVRPLQGIVALLGEQIVEFEIAGVKSGAATVGHRFHHPGIITIGGAHDYAEKLRACHVIVDAAERRKIIAEGAHAAARAAGLTLIEDDGLLHENAGLTEWPVPLLGRFDPAFLDVPAEVIQLTMRTNQKYFACIDGAGELAPNFICTANIEASDGGAIVAGNERVLSARLADAKFFWEQDLEVPLEEQAKKLGSIVFHEKLGTVADKVDRVAKLARWLVEGGIVKSSPERGGGPPAKPVVEGSGAPAPADAAAPLHQPAAGPQYRVDHAPHGQGSSGGRSDPMLRAGEDQDLATLAETAARLSKADLVTGLVGEFPELQGLIGGHLARAQGLDDAIADAISDHYKPVGQGDDVPTAPVTVAVSLADKLDTVAQFFLGGEKPTGSKDPFALRRAAIGILSVLETNNVNLSLNRALDFMVFWRDVGIARKYHYVDPELAKIAKIQIHDIASAVEYIEGVRPDTSLLFEKIGRSGFAEIADFFADRLKVQQREAGVRHDLIDAVFALGGEDDLVRLLARVKALQAFVETPEGADLLAGYKRAANILKKEGYSLDRHRRDDNGAAENTFSYTPESEEAALIAALDAAEPRAAAAIAAEDFEGAMAALASLRAPVDAFFDKVTVNDPDDAKREARLALLARMRDAVHKVADFSKIEG